MRRRKKQFQINDLSFIEFDKTISDPKNITKYDNGEITTLLSRFRRCLMKVENGEAFIRYLDNNNSNYYEDGSPAILTGADGDVMVYFPEYWYKYEKVDANKFRYYISLSEIEDGIHLEASLLGAYESYLTEYNTQYSRSGVVSTGNASSGSFVNSIAFIDGYDVMDYNHHCTIAMMFYAKYLTRDSQSVLGTGINSYSLQNGSTNHLGNRDTDNATSTYVNFLGIEAAFGGKLEFLFGSGVYEGWEWKISFPERSVYSAARSDGWIKSMQFEEGPYFDMIPTAVGGSNSTYYCDYYTQGNSSYMPMRSYSGSDRRGGLAFINASTYVNSNYAPDRTCRLAFKGNIHVI
ncbi:MAG: hypothetical protein LUG51_10530 [Tannerellaceae bacterium]|nr:hypothetical protein [Tannerellaceae bacterium]